MISFYKNRKIYFMISSAIILLGIILAFVNGINFDIEFTGGSILKYSYTSESDINLSDAEATAEESLGRNASAQTILDNITKEKKLVLSLAGNEGLSAENQKKLTEALKEKFPEMNIQIAETSIVEPFIGAQFINKAIISIILAFVLIILYVWYAFRKIGGLSAGVMAIVALVHDVIVAFMVFIIFQIPIDENFIAVALSIIGFSVNDTIVVYDRIRENTALYGSKMSIEDLVDKSINQSLTRSINTSLAIFFSVAIIFALTEYYGITSMRSFSLPMTFGTICGCYSTICIAGPLWVMWKKRGSKNGKLSLSKR